MAKKSIKEAEKEAEKDIEEEEESSSDADEEEEESSEESEEEEEQEEQSHTASARSAEDRRARRRERAKAQEHDDHGHGHGHDDDEESDGEDPYWWTPHAVMSALVLIGVLGFFGMFNRALGRFAAHPAGSESEAKPTTAQEATPPPQPVRPPTPPGMPGMDQREMFGAKHLLVMYKGSRRAPDNITRTKDEAKARATEAMKKAKDPKNKFEDLVKEYSDEPNAGARGGDLGKFPKGAMVPEFQNALDKMKVGDVSDIVETPFGYHVILRTQ